MQFGISMPAFSRYADPRYLAQTAKMAEDAGWDGFFIWEHVYDKQHPMLAPMIGMAAVAMATQKIRLGVMVTSLSRRRPWVFARETVSLDYLSDGRLVVGVGLGSPDDYARFNEDADARIRAEKLDEGLSILDGLWQGESFSFTGKHYHINDVTFLPKPLQAPRIPVWVGGSWNKQAPARRAAAWDGFFPLKWQDNITIDEWRNIMANVTPMRDNNRPYDWINVGETPGDNPDAAAAFVRPYAEVGITWWMEHVYPWRFGLDWDAAWTPDSIDRMNERIQQGPPQL